MRRCFSVLLLLPTLHALPRWFDDARLIRHSIVEAEALSDLTTQLWLNQLCSP